jgi:hypothetical protein
MSINANKSFKNNVDFAYESEKISNWLGNL